MNRLGVKPRGTRPAQLVVEDRNLQIVLRIQKIIVVSDDSKVILPGVAGKIEIFGTFSDPFLNVFSVMPSVSEEHSDFRLYVFVDQ